jgi:hypothetical protein
MLLPAPRVAVASGANQPTLHMALSHSAWVTSAHEKRLPRAATRRGSARRPGHLVINTDVVYRTVDFRDASAWPRSQDRRHAAKQRRVARAIDAT